MSHGTICLRCRKDYPQDCACVKPVPSNDGERPIGTPPGFDFRKVEYRRAIRQVAQEIMHNRRV